MAKKTASKTAKANIGDGDISEQTKKELREVQESIRSAIEKAVNEGAVKLEKALLACETRDCGGGGKEPLPGIRRSIKLVASHHIVDALCRAAESLRDQEVNYLIGVFRKQDLAILEGLAGDKRNGGKAEK